MDPLAGRTVAVRGRTSETPGENRSVGPVYVDTAGSAESRRADAGYRRTSTAVLNTVRPPTAEAPSSLAPQGLTWTPTRRRHGGAWRSCLRGRRTGRTSRRTAPGNRRGVGMARTRWDAVKIIEGRQSAGGRGVHAQPPLPSQNRPLPQRRRTERERTRIWGE